MNKILPYIIFSMIFTSCAVLNIASKDETRTCSLHEQSMKKTLVRVHYGRACSDHNSADYPNATCVKCMGCVSSRPRYRYANIWTCSTCTKIKRKHKREVEEE